MKSSSQVNCGSKTLTGFPVHRMASSVSKPERCTFFTPCERETKAVGDDQQETRQAVVVVLHHHSAPMPL